MLCIRYSIMCRIEMHGQRSHVTVLAGVSPEHKMALSDHDMFRCRFKVV